jgi:aminoglycoside phosphotransferase (APT) family kinase protein
MSIAEHTTARAKAWQFGYGQSNPTYQLTDKNGKKFVMRKKPPGKLLSKAHTTLTMAASPLILYRRRTR